MFAITILQPNSTDYLTIQAETLEEAVEVADFWENQGCFITVEISYDQRNQV